MQPVGANTTGIDGVSDFRLGRLFGNLDLVIAVDTVYTIHALERFDLIRGQLRCYSIDDPKLVGDLSADLLDSHSSRSHVLCLNEDGL